MFLRPQPGRRRRAGADILGRAEAQGDGLVRDRRVQVKKRRRERHHLLLLTPALQEGQMLAAAQVPGVKHIRNY